MTKKVLLTIYLFLLASCSTKLDYNKDSELVSNATINSVEMIKAEPETLNIAVVVSKKKNHSILRSVQIALDNAESDNVRLSFYDIAELNDDPKSFKTKILNEKIKAIIGPLYSGDTKNLSKALHKLNIPVLSLSNDEQLNDQDILAIGISPKLQATTITKFAVSQGLKYFYALLPANPYGEAAQAGLNKELDDKFGVARHTKWYTEENFDQVANEFLQEIAQKKNPEKNQAIFIPQGGSILSRFNEIINKIIPLPLVYLGSQSWDLANLSSLQALDGAFFLRRSFLNPNFSKQYRKLFKKNPDSIDLMAYNSALMLIKMFNDNIEITKKTILENNQLGSNYSQLKFSSAGEVLYDIEVVQLENGHAQVVDRQ